MKQKKYQKKEKQIVLALQINLDTEGLKYNKWGGEQQCQSGDWLVNNNGDCYTVNEESFDKTYTEIGPAQFVKTAPVWATQAIENGKVKTLEGFTEYVTGDYLVSNNLDGSDAYAVSKTKFETMYELVKPHEE